jgi:hypothetical protein
LGLTEMKLKSGRWLKITPGQRFISLSRCVHVSAGEASV